MTRRRERLARAVLGVAASASIALVAAPTSCTIANDLPVDPTFLTEADAVHVCALVAKCGGKTIADSIAMSTGIGVSAANFSVCLTWLAGPIPSNRPGLAAQRQMFQALAAANDCAGVARALYVRELDPSDTTTCPVKDPCSSDTLTDCTKRTVVRCASPLFPLDDDPTLPIDQRGARCVTSNGVSRCTTQGCATLAGDACASGVAIRCEDPSKPQKQLVCATLGSSCTEGATGVAAACQGDGQSLAPDWTTCSADGSHAQTSTGDLVSETDCSALGARCAQTPSVKGEAVCARDDDPCSPWNDGLNAINSCDGATRVVVCLGGAQKTLDCGAGFQCTGPKGQATCQ